LEGDGTLVGGEGFALVGDYTVDGDGDFRFGADDGYGVPFAEGLFFRIGGAEPAFAVVRAFACGFESFAYAPEIAGVAVFELGFE